MFYFVLNKILVLNTYFVQNTLNQLIESFSPTWRSPARWRQSPASDDKKRTPRESPFPGQYPAERPSSGHWLAGRGKSEVK